MNDSLRSLFASLKTAAANARRHDVPRLSAALAFYAILSLAPMLVITISVAGLVLDTGQVEETIVRETRDVVGDPAARIVANIVSSSRRPATNAIALGASLLFVFFGASRVFVHLYGAMQTIWETSHDGLKRRLQNRLIGVLMVLGTVVVLILAVAIQAAAASLLAIFSSRSPSFQPLFILADSLAAFVVTASLVATVYRYLPRARVRWGPAWSGAVLATLLLLAGRFAFGVYLRLGVTHTLQGAAGSLVVLVLWVYYVAQILFLGAEFTRARMLDT
jgi:membrane protein